MGYDLRMPAAFKALQRSRPPETVQNESQAPNPSSPVSYHASVNIANTSDEVDLDDDDQLDFGLSPVRPTKHEEEEQEEHQQHQQQQQQSVLRPDSPSSQPASEATEPPSLSHTHDSQSLLQPTVSSNSHQHQQHQQHQQQTQQHQYQHQYQSELQPSQEQSNSDGPVQHTATRTNLSRGASGVTVPQEREARLSGTSTAHNCKFAASAPSLVATSIDPADSSKLFSFASTSSFSAGVDRYGFKKPTPLISEAEFDDWADNYTKYMAHREVKWQALLKAHGLSCEGPQNIPVKFPPESQRLRRYVRKGIPPKWRGNAWFWFARGHEKLNARPGLYRRYVEETQTLRNSDTEHIERDLHRTFPDNIYFRNDPVTNEESEHLRALRRVLRAFSIYQQKIGYCQSLNFIAGNLLLFMDEERAFWMLVIITQNYLAGLHEVNLEQVNTSQGVLMISVRDRLPKIWSALNLEQSLEDNFISNLPPISLCTAPWFMSLMVNVLPTETMLRVWDCFFLEGPKTLYRIALTIFKLVEPQMSNATDELEVFQIIQSAPRRIFDPEVLMKACFKRANGFGHISNEDIALLRSFVQDRRKHALEGVEQPLNDRHAYAKLHRGRRVRAKLSLYR